MPVNGECLCVCPKGLYFDFRETKPRLRAMQARAITPVVLADTFTVERAVTSVPANPFIGFDLTPHQVDPTHNVPDVNVKFTNPLSVPVTVNAQYKKNGVNILVGNFPMPAGVSSKFFPNADIIAPFAPGDVLTIVLISIVPDVTLGSASYVYSIFPTTPPLSQNPVLVRMKWSTDGVGGFAITDFLYNAYADPHFINKPLQVASFTNANDPTFNAWTFPVEVLQVLDPASALSGYEIFNPNPDNGGKAWIPIAWIVGDDTIGIADPRATEVGGYKLLSGDDQVANWQLMAQLFMSFAYANAGDDQNNGVAPALPGTSAYGGNVIYKGDYPNYFENMDLFYGSTGDESWYQIMMWFMSALNEFWIEEAANQDAVVPIPGTMQRLYAFARKFFDIEDARFFLPGGVYQIAEPGSTTAPATAPYDPGLTDYITDNGVPIFLVMEVLSIG